jgi:hypothetical protein
MLEDEPTRDGRRREQFDQDMLTAAFNSPIHYVAVLHQLLDGGMTGLGTPAQRVYLQLVRESLARQRPTVRMTHDRLRALTGMSRPAIQNALKCLTSPDVDLVNIVSPGGPKIPACYEPRLFRYVKLSSGLRRKVRVRAVGSQGSNESILLQLKPDDQALLEQAYNTLDPALRRGYESEVKQTMRDCGWKPDAKVLRQTVLIRIMRGSTLKPHFKKYYPYLFQS